jgi:hypothetical protein
VVEYRVFVSKRAEGSTVKLDSVTYADAYTFTTDHLADAETDSWSYAFVVDDLDQSIYVSAEPDSATLDARWTSIVIEVYVDSVPYATVTGSRPCLDTTLRELLAHYPLTPMSFRVHTDSPSAITAVTYTDSKGVLRTDVIAEVNDWAYEFLLDAAEYPFVYLEAEVEDLPEASPEIYLDIHVKGENRRHLEMLGTTGWIDGEMWNLLTPNLQVSVGEMGDANRDGRITVVDALMTARYDAGLKVNGFNRTVADVNCSGTVDIVDALIIADYYVGNIAAFPCTLP